MDYPYIGGRKTQQDEKRNKNRNQGGGDEEIKGLGD
jgi:hypothetical protein